MGHPHHPTEGTLTVTPIRPARAGMALAMLLSSLTGIVAALAVPALRSTRSAELAAIAAHPGRFYVYALFLLASSYLLVPAFFGVMALLRDRGPRWAFFAGALAQAGLLIAIGDAATELMYWQMGAPGASRAQMVALAERYENAAGSSLIYTVGGLASLVGIALLAVGLWRTRVAPRWAAVALVAGGVANVVGFSVASQPVLIASYVVLLAAFAPMAQRLAGGRQIRTAAAPAPSSAPARA